MELTTRTARTPDGREWPSTRATRRPPGLVRMVARQPTVHLYQPVTIDAAVRGLRLISYDRPGYGRSDPQPGRTVADCAADVRAICAELGIGRLAMWGISGGGPHVLACAALLPDLVTAVASLASLAPIDAEGLDFYDGMGQDNAEDIQLFLRDPAAARAKMKSDREAMLATSAADLAAFIQTVLSPADAAAMRNGMADYLTYCDREGLAPGDQGWWDDSVAMARPWGFELAAISVPVLVMHGRQDKFVPFGHGQWLAGHIPGVEARLLDHDGHLTLLASRIPEVHSWLGERL